jgi:magnesium chelatase family protein
MYALLGLPDAALSESRDRVRAALVNCLETWPNKKVTVSLSPAWLPKSGSSFDLSIAIALMAANGSIPSLSHADTVFLGELALDGAIRSIRGVLPSLMAAYSAGVLTAIVPLENLAEAELMTHMKIIGMPHLKDVLRWLRTGTREEHVELDLHFDVDDVHDFSDVAGQPNARRAAEIAATGGHHLLLIGPPGAGKTMIADRIPTILPPLTIDQALEVTAVHSIAGALTSRSPLSLTAPIVAPHHSATRVAMVGGGSHVIRPGACSLAHHGVLFIDEAPECGPGILDALRQPLESGTISIARSIGNMTFPARFPGRGRGCTCTSVQVRRYLGKLSGPLMDRIDLRVQVDPVGRVDMARTELGESSLTIRNRVIAAREIAAHRFENESWKVNSQIPSRSLRTTYQSEKPAMNFLHDELDREHLTARGLHKVMRVSWTLADMKGHTRPTLEDVQEAHSLREGIEM